MDSEEEIPTGYENLFIIESYENKFGRIRASKALRGFSGKWKIEIKVNFLNDFILTVEIGIFIFTGL